MSSEGRPQDYWSDLAEQGERESEQASARYYGMRAEEYAATRWDLVEYETGHSDLLLPYEHRFSEREPARTGSDLYHYPGNRRRVQCKGARLKVKRNDGGRAGRFRLWDEDHTELVAHDALYLFLGYEPDDPDPVRCVRWIPARELDDAVGGLNWYDAEHSTKSGRPTDLSVKRIFPHL